MRLLPWLTLTACAHDPSHLAAGELHELLGTDPDRYAVVDVRSEGEFRSSLGHIAGAQHVAWPGIKEQAASIVAEPGQEIVLICFTGHRSRWSMPYVQAAFPDHAVRDLKGGMISWWSHRLPVAQEPRRDAASGDGKRDADAPGDVPAASGGG